MAFIRLDQPNGPRMIVNPNNVNYIVALPARLGSGDPTVEIFFNDGSSVVSSLPFDSFWEVFDEISAQARADAAIRSLF